MNIKYFCPRWGSESLTLKAFFQKVFEYGYDGIEVSLPEDAEERDELFAYIKEYDLPFVLQHWETVNPDFEEHKIEYNRRLETLAAARPLFVNSQTGKDYFSFEQNNELIAIAEAVSLDSGVKIIHETHRGKFSFAAHIMKPFLDANPRMELSLDISHWCNVAETFLDDQKQAVEAALQQTFHIHSRVGHTQSAQVHDPRDAEYQEALKVHLNWWQRVVDIKKARGEKTMTITTEFGPFPYMTLLPHTQTSISHQWEINNFIKNYLKENLAL